MSKANWPRSARVPLEPVLHGSGARRNFQSVTWRGRILPGRRAESKAPAAEWKDVSHLAPAALQRRAAACGVRGREFIFYADADRRQELRPAEALRGFTDDQLGEALGRKFVERTFGAEGKERTLKMVDALEKALGQDSRRCRG